MIMSDDIAREIIRQRTTEQAAFQRPRHPRTARLLRGLADRFDRSV